METILGKAPAIFNGHQPPRADDPYGGGHTSKKDFVDILGVPFVGEIFTPSYC